MLRVTRTVICDRVGCDVKVSYNDGDDPRLRADQDGWIIEPEGDWCPLHGDDYHFGSVTFEKILPIGPRDSRHEVIHAAEATTVFVMGWDGRAVGWRCTANGESRLFPYKDWRCEK